MLRSTRRGLETWHGRDGVTLADEERANREHELRPKPARQSPTLPMGGCGNGATVEPLRHRQTKGAETDMLSLTPPRHTSNYLRTPDGWEPTETEITDREGAPRS